MDNKSLYSTSALILSLIFCILVSASTLKSMENVLELLDDMLQAVNPNDRMVWKHLSSYESILQDSLGVYCLPFKRRVS